jgi:flagellar motor protein MotB
LPPEIKPAKIEAIFIEGHSDNVAVRDESEFKDNWNLSAARAIKTYKTLLATAPNLDKFLNENRLPIFSVSGYADRRPVASNATEAGRKLNRRIDLRFIMTPPKATPEVIRALEGTLQNLQ